MASSRKKQDENNLKTLRELASRPQNKFCFDCGQRGPTYVNVTIGSFVCTKCSGILRGITPPHRVKSISMATFTAEEIDIIRSKGNEYCRKAWLGLYEGTLPSFTDEQQVRDFMIEKYERKRYYLEQTMTNPEVPNTRPWINGTNNGKLSNGTAVVKNGFVKATPNGGLVRKGATRSRPEVKGHSQQQNGVNNNHLVTSNGFAVDFDRADIFSNTSTSSTGSSQNGFADFEHNQVYNANNNATNGMPTSMNAWVSQQAPLNPQNGQSTAPSVNSTLPPAVQDKYAALKDLDNEMKQQQHPDVWSTSNSGSTGSLYSSSTPNTGSVYGSPSPQGSIFGSPSQGQFANAFNNLQETNNTPQIANPFGTNSQSTQWASTNGLSNGFANSNGSNSYNNGLTNGLQAQPSYVNPFRDQLGKTNGFSNGFQPMFPSNGLNNGWGGNPFKVGGVTATTVNSNNPFL
ncbi:unnamed protein product [Ceutorhynchus assimilis]|uniref:Arf-GAP domain-containing protein n=1 Tax=Ceutorhynchus assimilis TaxID=467358 RepID=A0A9P0DMF2_9CUCU|nr:unnamed protein product [Ceutorhynchus assimilis]